MSSKYRKVFIEVAACVFLLLRLSSGNYDEEDGSVEVQHPELAKLIKMRCTRRFSPGVCVEEVAPVWTFVFFSQNCTERLGCPNNYRTNRFRSYRMCMKRCRALIDMYLQMVEFEEKNITNDNDQQTFGTRGSDRSDGDQSDGTDVMHLRGGLKRNLTFTSNGKKNILVNLEELTEEFEDEVYQEDQQTHAVVYKDVSGNEEIMTPDVDYVAGEIRSDLDVLLW